MDRTRHPDGSRDEEHETEVEEKAGGGVEGASHPAPVHTGGAGASAGAWHADAGLMSAFGLGGAKAPGRELPGPLKAGMEGSFGHDFSPVRVHEDGVAEAAGARAVADGTDLHFAEGEYQPASHEGRELIGHELAHVVQQGGQAAHAPQGKGAQLGGAPALEHEADVAGARAARGESVRVTGSAVGPQLKGNKGPKPVNPNQVFLDNDLATKVDLVVKERLDALEERLAAKAKVRFNADAPLIANLDKEAEAEVARLAAAGLDPKQQQDVIALKAKIARRSGAVKRAVAKEATDVAKSVVTAKDAYKTAFAAAAGTGFKSISLPKKPDRTAVIARATAAARSAATAIDTPQYKGAKLDLDTKLGADVGTRKTRMAADVGAEVAAETTTAIDKRKDLDANNKLGTLADETKQPAYDRLHDEVEKYLAHGLGANGAGFYRSTELKKFRKEMKQAGRQKAKQDIHEELNPTVPNSTKGSKQGPSTKRFLESEARIDSYAKAKTSVNTALAELAVEGTTTTFTTKNVDEELTNAAREAAFAVYDGDGRMPAARAAGLAAAKAKGDALRAPVLSSATIWKDQIVAKRGKGVGTEHQDAEDRVTAKVHSDSVGQKAVEVAIKGNGPEEGMSKLGHFFDLMVPERGDALKFKVSLEIPCGPGSILIELQGDAERGGRERFMETDDSGNETLKRDTSSLKIGAEVRLGYTLSFPGLKVGATLGFFTRSDAASTDMCMKALSYGWYRSLSHTIPPLANLWGGNQTKAKAMTKTGANPKPKPGGAPPTEDDLDDEVYRAELWAAMVEEQVFVKDHEARVDIGGSFNAGAEANVGIAGNKVKGKGGLRGEAMQSFDHEHMSSGLTGGKKLGDSSFDKVEAKKRRAEITGYAAGRIIVEAEVEVAIHGVATVFGVKATIAISDKSSFEIELSAALKLSSTMPSNVIVGMVPGIVGACVSGVKSIIGIVRDGVEKDQGGKVSGGKVAGNVVQGLTGIAEGVDSAAGNYVGQALTHAYQVSNDKTDMLMGSTDVSGTHAGAIHDTLYRLTIVTGGPPFKFLVKLDEVQSSKVSVGIGGLGLNLEYEKSRRMAQIGVSDGKFHGELMGVSTKT